MTRILRALAQRMTGSLPAREIALRARRGGRDGYETFVLTHSDVDCRWYYERCMWDGDHA